MAKRVLAGLLAILSAALFLLPCSARAEEMETVWLPSEEPEEEVSESVFQPGETAVTAGELEITAPCAILMEASTGTVLYEKNADQRTEPASVTKLMTMLLIAEAVESGALALTDVVTVSAHAAGLGGSQIFLAQGERMEAGELLKAMAVASANDAACALAEQLCGTEEAFAAVMNRRAGELGMQNTVFCNCSGLDPAGEHLTTARDVAILSREVLKHRWLLDYTTIWTDTVRGGAFGLTNTNKLIRYYPGATGLKTGFTAAAGFCVAASALRDGMEVIAVILHADTSAHRFGDASTLMSYAFANYTLVSPLPEQALPPIPVHLGQLALVQPVVQDPGPVLVPRTQAGKVEKSVSLAPEVWAPVSPGDLLGTLTVTVEGRLLGEYPIVAADGVARLTWGELFVYFLRRTMVGS